MRVIYLLIFSFCVQIISAQTKDTLDNNKLIEVVVTGQIDETKNEDAIHKIRVIGSKVLNSGLFNELSSVLSKELNIKLSEDNILGSSIAIQGISGQNVKILIDDVPAIGRLNGNIDLSQISLNNIERIEIVEGPLSTIYGTDALAGTINIITKEHTENKKVFKTYYETIGKYNYDFLISENRKNNTAIYQFGRNYFNGWSEDQEFKFIPTQEVANNKRFKQWKPKEQISHKLSYNIRKDKYSNNNYIERFYEKITNRGIPQGPYLENAFDEYYHTYKTNIGSDIKLKYNTHKFRLILAYNNYVRAKETIYKDLTNLSEITVQNESMQDTSHFKLWMIKAIVSNIKNDKLKYQLGIDLNKQNAKGKRIINQYQEKNDYALFSTIEYRLNDVVKIRPALRLIYNDNYKAPIAPALNALFDWKKYQIRFSYAKGFRAPDFKELFFEFIDINHNIVGNESLLAEKSDNFNINTTFSSNIIKNKIVTDISLFFNRISNKIDLASSSLETNQYSYFNIENYETKGISFRSSLSFKNTEINFGMAYTGRYNKLSEEYDINKFNFSNDVNLSILYHIGKKNKLNIYYKRVGQLPNFVIDNNNPKEVYSEEYNILDFSLNRRIYNDQIILTIGGKNLFDITDIKQFSDNTTAHTNTNNTIPIGYGRTFFTSIKFKL